VSVANLGAMSLTNSYGETYMLKDRIKVKYRIHIKDTSQSYGFYTSKDLCTFLSLIDLEDYKEWYAEVVKEQSRGEGSFSGPLIWNRLSKHSLYTARYRAGNHLA